MAIAKKRTPCSPNTWAERLSVKAAKKRAQRKRRQQALEAKRALSAGEEVAAQAALSKRRKREKVLECVRYLEDALEGLDAETKMEVMTKVSGHKRLKRIHAVPESAISWKSVQAKEMLVTNVRKSMKIVGGKRRQHEGQAGCQAFNSHCLCTRLRTAT